MSEAAGILVVLVAGLGGALAGAFLSAAILRWRALKLRGWSISFGSAYLVAAAAAVAAVIGSDLAALLLSSVDGNDQLLRDTGRLVGLVIWWFVHAAMLERIAGATVPLTVKEARALSANVFAYFVGMIFALAVVCVVVFFVFRLFSADKSHDMPSRANSPMSSSAFVSDVDRGEGAPPADARAAGTAEIPSEKRVWILEVIYSHKPSDVDQTYSTREACEHMIAALSDPDFHLASTPTSVQPTGYKCVESTVQ